MSNKIMIDHTAQALLREAFDNNVMVTVENSSVQYLPLTDLQAMAKLWLMREKIVTFMRNAIASCTNPDTYFNAHGLDLVGKLETMEAERWDDRWWVEIEADGENLPINGRYEIICETQNPLRTWVEIRVIHNGFWDEVGLNRDCNIIAYRAVKD